jgi:tetratricopeptide (TPR) repeat protein
MKMEMKKTDRGFTMSLRDLRGVPVSTRNRRSLDALEIATEQFHTYAGDPLAVIDAALAENPAFVMGHAVRAGLLAMSMEKSLVPEMNKSLRAAETLAEYANDREWRHIAAGRAWAQGDFAGAVERWSDILFDYPRDSLALQLAHRGDLHLGRSRLLRDRIAWVLPYWNDRVPGYGHVLGMHALGLAEMGDYCRAEDTGRKAVVMCRRDVWAIHAVAHVMEMEGRLEEGVGWMTERVADWANEHPFACHNWWHLALFHLDLGQYKRVLDIFDSHIHADVRTDSLVLVDAASLLWRLYLQGIEVGDRWEAVADAFEPKAEDGFYAFTDMHAMMAFVGAGRAKAADWLLDRLQRRIGEGGTGGVMTREAGLPVCAAFKHFGRGDFTAALELLMQVRPIANRAGGSQAQRDVVALTMIEAALRSGKGRVARALAAERTDLKPHSPFNWTVTARAFDLMGDHEGAEMARTKATLQRVRPRLVASA